MSIELRQLRYAVAAADAQSFTRAAAALNVKQITLSRRVQQLEDRLGVKLFERSTRGAEITKNGRPFIEQARHIVTDVDDLRTTAHNVSYGLQGRIAVGYCSPPVAGKPHVSRPARKFIHACLNQSTTAFSRFLQGL